MPKDMREPQSYGSEKDWVTGETGGKVNNQKSPPTGEHREFYDDKRESETSNDFQGGRTSPQQLAENAQPTGEAQNADSQVPKVTGLEGGAKRDSFFRKRDYE